MEIGERIKQLREQTNITQSQLANYLEIDQTYLSKIESGERTFPIDLIEKISNLFGIETKDLEKCKRNIKPIKFSLRAKTIDTNDLKSIALVNRIAINSKIMNELLEKKDER